VPFELPADRRPDRRAAIGRWATFALVALLVAALAYLAYVGFVGSDQATHPARSGTCTTPQMAFGWDYEPVNYDPLGDERLADADPPGDCAVAARAGTSLVTEDGVRLAAWYVPAGNGAGPEAPTIVLAHGHTTNKSDLLGRAELLHPEYNLVLFDFRAHGQSGGSESTIGLLEQTDLRTVIDWLEAEKGPGAIGVLGVSMGGSAAVNEARADQRVTALVVESTHATLANALQARLDRQGYPLSLPGAWAILLGGLVRTGQDMSAADPLQAIEDYGDRPLLLVTGGRDDTFGPNDTDDLLAAAEAGGADATLEVCEPAGHGGSPDACPDDYREWVLGFFAEALGS
jgi:pimeloyl-ACP methyl ester carboxylesterase